MRRRWLGWDRPEGCDPRVVGKEDDGLSSIPFTVGQWYRLSMSGTYTATMGDRGRLVIPFELRRHAGLTEGVPVVLVETDTGIVVMTREQARTQVRGQLTGTDLVAELLAERRRAAESEDAA